MTFKGYKQTPDHIAKRADLLIGHSSGFVAKGCSHCGGGLLRQGYDDALVCFQCGREPGSVSPLDVSDPWPERRRNVKSGTVLAKQAAWFDRHRNEFMAAVAGGTVGEFAEHYGIPYETAARQADGGQR